MKKAMVSHGKEAQEKAAPAFGMAAILAALVILNLPSPSTVAWRKPPVLMKGLARIVRPAV